MVSPRVASRGSASLVLPSATQSAILATVIVAALYFGRSVFVPLALAVLLSFVLSPLVVWLRKLHLPRALAVGVVVAGSVVTFVALGMAMARQVTDLGTDLPRYESTLRQKLKSLRTGVAQTGIVDKATSTLKELGKELEQPPRPASGAKPTSTPAPDSTRPIPVEIHTPPDRPLDIYQKIVSALLAPLTTTAIVIILIIFILLQRDDLRDRVIRLVGARDIELTTTALNDAAFRLSRLFLATAAINVGFGAVIAAGLWMIGVPSPLLWGIVAALMRFVPYVGAVLAAVFPLLLAAAVDPGWTMVAWTFALYVIVEPAVGHFLEPWVHGQTTGLSPLAIVVSAILWTALWGPIGLLLATPLTMCLVVLGRHVEGLAFLDVILGDRPALTPPEVFYQRLLAESSAEAAEQAQQVLKEASLIEYYDKVALPGLKLASLDAHRGAIDEERMSELRAGVVLLVDDLSDAALQPPKPKPAADATVAEIAPPASTTVVQEDELLPAWRTKEPPVLCLAARTPLDAAAAEILADLLRRQGIGARAAAVPQLSDLANLGVDVVQIVWISSVDAAQSHAHIRYLIRRLRRTAPNVMFCGGFWDGAASDTLVEGIGIAHRAANFAAAVEITRTMATGREDSKRVEAADRPLAGSSVSVGNPAIPVL